MSNRRQDKQWLTQRLEGLADEIKEELYDLVMDTDEEVDAEEWDDVTEDLIRLLEGDGFDTRVETLDHSTLTQATQEMVDDDMETVEDLTDMTEWAPRFVRASKLLRTQRQLAGAATTENSLSKTLKTSLSTPEQPPQSQQQDI